MCEDNSMIIPPELMGIKVEAVEPGFINFTLPTQYYLDRVGEIAERGVLSFLSHN